MQPVLSTFKWMTDGPEMSNLLVHESGRLIPGSVKYSVRRYVKPQGWMAEDTGMLQYHVAKNDASESKLELHFCITGAMYCREQAGKCALCKANNSANCGEKFESVDLLHFTFTPSVLTQFVKSRSSNTLADEVMLFTHATSFSQLVPLCN